MFIALMTGGESDANLPKLFRELISLEFMLPGHLCSLFLEVALLIFYLIHTIKNTRASDAMRIGLGYLFLPFVAVPIYYYLYIWREGGTSEPVCRMYCISSPENSLF